jgi:hypothetical protein
MKNSAARDGVTDATKAAAAITSLMRMGSSFSLMSGTTRTASHWFPAEPREEESGACAKAAAENMIGEEKAPPSALTSCHWPRDRAWTRGVTVLGNSIGRIVLTVRSLSVAPHPSHRKARSPAVPPKGAMSATMCIPWPHVRQIRSGPTVIVYPCAGTDMSNNAQRR